MREASITRSTNETKIELKLNLDGSGESRIDSGVGFLDHMLTLLSFHSGIDLALTCVGDTQVDDHHSCEDIGITLGRAISDALGEKKGIARYGSFLLPMDEALVLCALDLSGRCHVNFDVQLPTEKVGAFDTELVKEFFLALARNLDMTLHLKMLAGENSHHIIEACFKGFGRALRQAVAVDPNLAGRAASSKGTLA